MNSLDEWAERSSVRYGAEQVAKAVAAIKAEIRPAPGHTVDEAIEAIAAFLLTDPTLPTLPATSVPDEDQRTISDELNA